MNKPKTALQRMGAQQMAKAKARPGLEKARSVASPNARGLNKPMNGSLSYSMKKGKK